jgi:hypothetical protein
MQGTQMKSATLININPTVFYERSISNSLVQLQKKTRSKWHKILKSFIHQVDLIDFILLPYLDVCEPWALFVPADKSDLWFVPLISPLEQSIAIRLPPHSRIAVIIVHDDYIGLVTFVEPWMHCVETLCEWSTSLYEFPLKWKIERVWEACVGCPLTGEFEWMHDAEQSQGYVIYQNHQIQSTQERTCQPLDMNLPHQVHTTATLGSQGNPTSTTQLFAPTCCLQKGHDWCLDWIDLLNLKMKGQFVGSVLLSSVGRISN